MSAPGYEFLRLALENGWILLPVLLNLPMVLTFPTLGRARRSLDGWLLRVTGAAGASALGLGVFNLLRPLPLPVDGDRLMYGHLGTAYWVWSASFALVAVSLWLRDREWAPGRPDGIGGVETAGAPLQNGHSQVCQNIALIDYYIYRTSISNMCL